MNECLLKARAVLENVTPLKSNCGRLCGAACCASLEGEETGMLLFPGEEKAYPFDTLRTLPDGRKLFVCSGSCERASRPLSCRLFPLLPVVRGGTVSVETDARSAAVCPLCDEGLDSFSPAFLCAVREAGEALLQDREQASFLERLQAEQDELLGLRKLFGG